MAFRNMMMGALVLGVVSAPALAQTAGTYTGTTADGQTVSFTVTQNGAGDYSLTGENISYTAPCKNSTTTLNTDWGTGYTAPITNRVVRFSFTNDYFFFTGVLHFTGSTLYGTLASTGADLSYDSTGRPTKALFCSSPSQNLTATLTSMDSAARRAGAAPQAVMMRSQSVRQTQH